MKKSSYGFSLILPCYNDRESIEEAVKKSDKTLHTLFNSYEIILVNDASTDNSNEVFDSIQKKHSSVKVINNSINMGQGTSILMGFNIARFALVMHNGIDLPFEINDLKNILPLFSKSDIIVIERGKMNGYSGWRKFVSITNRILRYIFFHVPFSDLNSV